MFKIMPASEAIDFIKDGDCIAINSFLALSNPEELHNALNERFERTNHPNNLRIFCAAGFGGWDENRFADQYISKGAVKEIVAGHYGSMPIASRFACESKIEAYNLPLGALSHAIRAAAAGKDGVLSEVGLNTFVDPRMDTPALNAISKKELVSFVNVDNKEYLYYKTPKIDIAFIKGTTVDPNGNISFEKEYLTVDALSLAQATKANGGIVIVQVEQVSHVFARPRNTIIPGILVDAVVVYEEPEQRKGYSGALSGDIHVPATHMDYYMGKINTSRKSDKEDQSVNIIGERGARELQAGQIVNIGIGIPETVGKYASKLGILKDIVTTVEAGGIGGLPAPGVAFGATIGADMICDMGTQFDFYDGGGLDICFMGGLEVDRHGNVNAHKLDSGFPGIGGFINITHATKTIVFCMTFTTKGLIVTKENGVVNIKREGSIPKFKSEIRAISFSAKNALKKGQRVLYVTERCVFELGHDGLKLKEVFDGVNPETQIFPLLDYSLEPV